MVSSVHERVETGVGCLGDPETLHGIARKCARPELSRKAHFDLFVSTLAEGYPRRIETSRRWVLNSANGTLGTMTLLYASLSEYLLIQGSPIGTEEHSGRHFATVQGFMVEGEMWVYLEGSTERTVFRPGAHAMLAARGSKGYLIRENGWMLEHASRSHPGDAPRGHHGRPVQQPRHAQPVRHLLGLRPPCPAPRRTSTPGPEGPSPTRTPATAP
jgi:C-8 sterol isomerase